MVPRMKSQNHHPEKKTARSLALDILDDVFGQGRTIDESMESRAYEKGISLVDKAFAYRLASEVTRRKGVIDALLATFLTKPLKPSQQRVYHAMMLGVVQLCVLDTPAHAAVHETVQVIADSSFAPLKGLVNAILQSILRKAPECKKQIKDAKNALPEWIAANWRSHYGDAFCADVSQMLMKKPPLDIAVKSDAVLWAQKLEGVVLQDNIIRIDREVKVEELPGYKEGAWWVQDIGASLSVRALGDVGGKHVLDICAAPGGKTAQLLAHGATVTALDNSVKRMERFKTNMARLGYKPEVIVADIRKWEPPVSYDAVLLDAPCSATGTLRKHPEVLWIRKSADVAKMAVLQRECLHAVLAWLPAGVPLVYTVCSLEPEEGEQLVSDVIKFHRGVTFDRIPMENSIFSGATLEDGSIRLLPTQLAAQGGNDGFYVARLIKQ
jgi:16S rRNA (cytosine967-C5)-methyltransferase